MTSPIDTISPANIAAALRGFYTPPKPGNAVVSGLDLVALLRTLPTLSRQDHVDPVLVQLRKHHPGASFRSEDDALLSFVDDATTQILRGTDLDFKIECFVRDLSPLVAIAALEHGVRSITEPQPILHLIDLLIRECIGWSEDLGILGDQFMEKVQVILGGLFSQRASLATTLEELETFFAKERPIFATMQQRLVASELNVLAGEKGKYYAAELLNQRMSGKPLPLFIIFLLQGSWYEFLQRVFIAYGQKSKQWQDANKITEALIWSLIRQPDKVKHEALMSALPAQIRAFCAELSFDTAAVVTCMADVEEEYRLIRANTPSDPCDFDLLPIDPAMVEGGRQIDAAAHKQIEALTEGQWLLYEDKKESAEKIARVTLILNWRDTDRLLFTNHNRRKVLHMSYGELAGYLSSQTVKLLNIARTASELVGDHLLTVIQGIHQQKLKEVEIEEVQARKQVSQEYLAKRKATLVKALEQHKRLAALKKKRAMILRQKAAKKLEAATAAVKGLRVEAWMKLPVMEGTLTPCRLVAFIPAADKYIFANRAGIKVAEYTGGQLSHLIVTENSEILDTGAEFENVLASVVMGLRQDKNKSYDQLTGDTG